MTVYGCVVLIQSLERYQRERDFDFVMVVLTSTNQA